MPELSVSVDSARSTDSDASSRLEDSDFYRPVIVRSDSTESRSRGPQRHFTSLDLSKMVSTIKEEKQLEPLEQRLADSIPKLPSLADAVIDDVATPEEASPAQLHKSTSPAKRFAAISDLSQPTISVSSDKDEDSCRPLGEKVLSMAQLQSEAHARSSMKSLSVVRGFSPNHVSSSYRSSPQLSSPAQEAVDIARRQKGKATFVLGVSSGEEDSSLDDHMSYKHSQQRNAAQQDRRQQEILPHRSSLSEGLRRNGPKQTSFNEQVTRRFYPGADSDSDEVSESAIEDDDSSDWDDMSESERDTPDEKVTFQRVDSRPNLVSRPSLLSKFLKEGETTIPLTASRSTPAIRSRTSTPVGPSVAASPTEESGNVLTMKGMLMPRSKPILVAQPVLSPRTTRRNMLTTELTESLRRNLLVERQQKNVNAAFKRRHTAHDVANLKDYPGPKVVFNKNDMTKNVAWNNYFDHGLGEYHQKGW
jgi:hypothetical protein